MSKATAEKRYELLRYRRTLEKIENLNLRIKDIDARMASGRVSRLSPMPRGGEPVSVDDMLAIKEELLARRSRLAEVAKAEKLDILFELDTLDKGWSEIMELYYIDNLSPLNIGLKLGFAESTVNKNLSLAVAALAAADAVRIR